MGIELSNLFAPLGPAALEHVVVSNGLELAPMLDQEHLVVAPSYRHARTLARARVLEPGGDGACFLVKVEVVTGYLQRLEPRVVGRGDEVELWIPRSAFPGFNRRIARPMRMLHAVYGPGYAGRALPGHSMFGDDIHLFLAILEKAPSLEVPRSGSAERWAERLRRLRHVRARIAELEHLVQRSPGDLEHLIRWSRLFRGRNDDELWKSLARATGLRTDPAARPEGAAERLLRAARLWLLCNLAFWRVTGSVSRARLLELAERLHDLFPHPGPTLRGTLVDP